uniref:Uncharacterized protein n=1 Tax=Anopheles merus TaxID=30066 RepID=A0A182V5B0_ANOME
MMMGMMVMVWTSTRSSCSSCSRSASRIADTVVLARSRQQPVVWWLRRHIGTGMVLLQVVERLGRTALGRRLLGLAARMVRGLMMRLMVRLMMWWRWLMVLGVLLLLLLLGRLRMYSASSRRTGRHTLDLPRSASTAGRRWPALALLRLLYMIIYMARAGSTRAAGLLRVRGLAAGADTGAEGTASGAVAVVPRHPRGSASGAVPDSRRVAAGVAVADPRCRADPGPIGCRAVAVAPAPVATGRTLPGIADAASNSRASVVNTAATAEVAAGAGAAVDTVTFAGRDHPAACLPGRPGPSCTGHRACAADGAVAPGSLGRPSRRLLLPTLRRHLPATTAVTLGRPRVRTTLVEVVAAAAGRKPTGDDSARLHGRGVPVFLAVVLASAAAAADRARDCCCCRRADGSVLAVAGLALASDCWMDEEASKYFVGLERGKKENNKNTIRLHCTAGKPVATAERSKQQLLLLSPTDFKLHVRK